MRKLRHFLIRLLLNSEESALIHSGLLSNYAEIKDCFEDESIKHIDDEVFNKYVSSLKRFQTILYISFIKYL